MAQVKSLNCPNCGDSIPDTSKACPSCGSRVILSDDRQKFVLAGTICPKCGLDNKEQHRFCSKCGDKLFKECLKCKKEIGLDAMHCPFCGNNIDSLLKEREAELALQKEGLSQISQIRQKIAPLHQKIQVCHDKRADLINQKHRRITIFYGEDLPSGFGYFLVVYPIAAVILAGITKAFGLNFELGFIVSYLGIFFYFQLWPCMRGIDIDARIASLDGEIQGIGKDIEELSGPIPYLEKKYRIK